jgi:hypothetical protein
VALGCFLTHHQPTMLLSSDVSYGGSLKLKIWEELPGLMLYETKL